MPCGKIRHITGFSALLAANEMNARWVVCPKRMKVLRYHWPTDFKFLLDKLINPAKL